jgi:hypothetical protein
VAFAPDMKTIYERAAQLRASWPLRRLEKDEGISWEMEVTAVIKVTDHMKRKPESGGDRHTR